MKPCVVVTGGGTGGHVFPALAVAEELQAKHDLRLVWIGGTRGIERSIVRRWGMEFYGIPAGKLRRYLSLENIRDVFRTLAGFFRALSYLRRLKPVALFSKGGFVSVPPVLAAGLLGIPVISHESDYDPGLATKINLRFSRRVCVAYPESLRFYPKGKAVLTGNPVRTEIFKGSAAEGLRLLGFTAGDPRPVLFIQGGSLGARQINELVDASFPVLSESFRIVHQRGKGEWSRADQAGSYLSQPSFASEYPHILAAADLVLSRAGAGSLWEMGVLAKPGVLIPLDGGSRGDQLRNAELCARHGACLVFRPEDYAQAAEVQAAFVTLLTGLAADGGQRAAMASAWQGLVSADGARKAAALVEEYL